MSVALPSVSNTMPATGRLPSRSFNVVSALPMAEARPSKLSSVKSVLGWSRESKT